MNKIKLVTKDTYYLGASDRRIALFENVYPLTNGVSYNSYLIKDEKTCLLDTVDKSVEEIFYKKLELALDGKPLDYIIVQHMEPDHSFSLHTTIKNHPEATVVMNEKILRMYKNYNNDEVPEKYILVIEGDTLSLGEHILTFVFAPMVHWPEVMVTYDILTKTLFSADAFGTFNALSGNLFAHEMDFDHDYLDEARRYYTNIVGKYGPQVQATLKKAATIDIQTICPLHGPIWRQDLAYIIDKYDKWSSYTPEKQGVLIVYGSVYGHSEEVANVIADQLGLLGIRDIHMYDASKTDKSYLVSETFKYSHLVICSSTYNMGIFTPMEEYLLDLKYHNMQNRRYVIVENGSWAPNSGKLIKEIFDSMKNMTQIGKTVTIASALKDCQEGQIEELVNEIANDFPKVRTSSNPLFNISYGLYVLTTKDGDRLNGCIINTANQVANNPDRIMICVNKLNHTAKVVSETKKCTLNILNTHTPFALIKRFGFASGKDTDKFADFNDYRIGSNGLPYLTKYINSYINLKVEEIIDLGSHYGYICAIESSKAVTNEASLTYTYYQDNIKPKAPRNEKKVKGWICKICGYVYEGEELPKDFICPLCKHGASDFERIK